MKLKELRQAYQKTQEANTCSGSEPQTCRFYDELHTTLGGAPTTTPHLYVDSCRGVSHNRNEEDDEDGEVEDSVHQASGETLIPDSQELFITLESIPSQPGLPDLESREGTSAAANVSTLPLASPSQRLAQVRRRKKRIRNEMFSELRQSTQTERTQQNAWRQTMAESRKAQNEHKDRWLEQEERWRQRDERRQDAMLRLLEDQTDMLRRMVEMQERDRPPLQPLCNQPPSPTSSIASSPRRPRMRGGGREMAPGTQPLHPRGLPKQQKAGIQ
nr:uncharacterized protein LOC125620592 isoform X1 [Caretta caretta]